MRVFVIGGSGLVGRNVVEHCRTDGHEVRSTYRTASDDADVELDKRDERATVDAVTSFDPDVVIDTAAFHAVDDCETERDRAWAVNAEGTRNAAIAADEASAHYVYLSTDYVFPGKPDDAPYHEHDPVAPINYYARTKYAGEQAAVIAERSTVLRPSVIYGLHRDNFATWALGELGEGNEVGIVDDQVSRPTYAPDLATACLEVPDRELTGLYHATGPQSLSRYEFTLRLAEAYDLDSSLVNPITTEELGQSAPRPADSSLDSRRLYEAIDSEFRAPKDGFETMHERS